MAFTPTCAQKGDDQDSLKAVLPTAWTEFNSVEGRFRILTPGDFTEKTDSVTTPLGKLAHHTFYFQSEDKAAENLFYMVSYCDYPESVVFEDSTDLAAEFFAATIESAAEAVKGKLIYSADIQLDAHPGKFWRIDYLDGKCVIKTKAWLAGSRYYAVQTISWQEKNTNSAGDKFFDSFRVL